MLALYVFCIIINYIFKKFFYFRLDCIGILKICTYNTKKKKRISNDFDESSTSLLSSCSGSSGTSNNQASVRIAIRAYILNDISNEEDIAYTETDPICCSIFILYYSIL